MATVVLAWDYNNVVEIYKRHNLLKDRAVEIFFSDGQTYLIAFEDQEVCICLARQSTSGPIDF